MNDKKIAVIGAGLAGLTAAYRLRQAGLNVDVFEAKSRIGGRVFTVLMENSLGQITEVELGGQNITDGGEAIHFLALAKELNLKVQEKVIHLEALVYYNGQYFDYNELVENHNKTYKELSAITERAENIGDLIDLFCEDNKPLRQALLCRMTVYEGVDAYRQSIYHNIETLRYSLMGGVAKSHEAYAHEEKQIVTSFIEGGNARLPLAMKEALINNMHFHKALTKICMTSNSFQIEFKDKSSYDYDFIVLAIPASTYKDVDLSCSGIEASKLSRIHSIQYGGNFKIALPFDLKGRNHYRSVLTDSTTSFFNADETVALLYVNNPLADVRTLSEISAQGMGIEVKEKLKKPFPVKPQDYVIYKDSFYHDWKSDPYAQGSYSCYSTLISEELDRLSWRKGIGYKSLFAPAQGSLFFAGEHTTLLDCVGTMEAAVESGERVAKALINTLKQTKMRA